MRIAAALHVPVTAFYDAAARRKNDRGLPYLNSAGAVPRARVRGDPAARLEVRAGRARRGARGPQAGGVSAARS
jgi:hypothetical protein